MNGNTDIALLLVRYYNGETSLQEERELYAYFSRPEEEIPEKWRKDRQLFLLLTEEKAPVLIPEGMQERLERKLNCWERAEQTSRKQQREYSRRTWFLWPMAAAAVIAACYFAIPPQQENNTHVAQIVQKQCPPDHLSTEATQTASASTPAGSTPEQAAQQASQTAPPHKTERNAGTKQMTADSRTKESGSEDKIFRTLTPEERALLEKGLQLYTKAMQERQDLIASVQQNVELLHQKIEESMNPLYLINL